MLIRSYLALMAAMYAAFGLWSLLQPLAMAASLGVEVGGPNGAYELRGVYGGISLASALFCAAGAVRDSLLRPALWFITVYMGGYLFARAAALLLGPPPVGYSAFIAFEALSFLLAVLSLRALARR
jgi:hypothetical protein